MTFSPSSPITSGCQCAFPLIKCDRTGCRCTVCGELERLPPLPAIPALPDDVAALIDRLRRCGKYLMEHTPHDLLPDADDPDPDNTIFDEAATALARSSELTNDMAKVVASNAAGEVSIIHFRGRSFVHGSMLDEENAKLVTAETRLKEAVAAERERCAMVAEKLYEKPGWSPHYKNAASAIAGLIRCSVG